MTLPSGSAALLKCSSLFVEWSLHSAVSSSHDWPLERLLCTVEACLAVMVGLVELGEPLGSRAFQWRGRRYCHRFVQRTLKKKVVTSAAPNVGVGLRRDRISCRPGRGNGSWGGLLTGNTVENCRVERRLFGRIKLTLERATVMADGSTVQLAKLSYCDRLVFVTRMKRTNICEIL